MNIQRRYMVYSVILMVFTAGSCVVASPGPCSEILDRPNETNVVIDTIVGRWSRIELTRVRRAGLSLHLEDYYVEYRGNCVTTRSNVVVCGELLLGLAREACELGGSAVALYSAALAELYVPRIKCLVLTADYTVRRFPELGLSAFGDPTLTFSAGVWRLVFHVLTGAGAVEEWIACLDARCELQSVEIVEREGWDRDRISM